MSRANPRYRRRNLNLPALTNDVFRVKLYGTIENQETISVFTYIGPSLVNNAVTSDLTDFGSALVAVGNLCTKYAAACSADWVFTRIAVDVPTTPSLAPIIVNFPGNGAGPAGHMPTEVGMPLLKITASRGQCGRGRISTPAVPTAWVTASVLSNTGAHSALAFQMIQNLVQGPSTWRPCVYSAKGSRLFPIPGAALLTNAILPAGNLLGTIRRRKIGRGK